MEETIGGRIIVWRLPGGDENRGCAGVYIDNRALQFLPIPPYTLGRWNAKGVFRYLENDVACILYTYILYILHILVYIYVGQEEWF